MGLAYNTYLTSNKIYGCKTCKAHLANHEDIISRVRIPQPKVVLYSLIALTSPLCTALHPSVYIKYVPFSLFSGLTGRRTRIRTSVGSMAKRTCSIESSTLTRAIQMSEI